MEAIVAHPYHHALSSVKKWGGTVEDYQRIHDWFDESKKIIADFRHRALRHHAEGIFMAETIFGTTITISTGREVPVGQSHPPRAMDGPRPSTRRIRSQGNRHRRNSTRLCATTLLASS
jgi:hypothetical protein